MVVETGVNYLRPRSDELRDGNFVRRVSEAADCGLLLDLHNVFTNALNGRQPLDAFLDDLPLERVWEVHLAGGMELDGFWLDAHSGAIPDALYSVAEQLIPRLPNLGAIIFEIFPSFVPVVGLDLVEEQIHRLHALWRRRAPLVTQPSVGAVAPHRRVIPRGVCREPRMRRCQTRGSAPWARSSSVAHRTGTCCASFQRPGRTHHRNVKMVPVRLSESGRFGGGDL